MSLRQAVGGEATSLVPSRQRLVDQICESLFVFEDSGFEAAIVSGESGSGKTRVIREIARRAEQKGIRSVWARCWEAEGVPDLWPWLPIMRTLIGSDHALITRMESSTPVDHFHLFDEISTAIAQAAEASPVLLIFDELQALDDSSLELLSAVLQERHGRPFGVLAAHRTDSRAAQRRPALASIVRRGRRFEMRNLSEEETAAVFTEVAGFTPPSTVLATVYRASEGNPFFLHEVLRAVLAEEEVQRPDHSTGFRVPEGAQQLIDARLSTLPAELRKVLEVASVIGRDFVLGRVASLIGLSEDETFDRLAGSVARGILVEISAAGSFSFSHVLIREALYEELDPSERHRLHSKAAADLIQSYGETPDRHLDEIAHHLFKASHLSDPDETLRYLILAGDRALQAEKTAIAERHLWRALSYATARALPEDRVEQIEERLAGITAHALAHADVANAFWKEGDVWLISYEGRSFRLKDSKGLGYLAVLFKNPGTEIHAVTLAGFLGPGVEEGYRDVAASSTGEGFSSGFGDAGDLLDVRAKAEYKRRLEDLQESMEEAERFNDDERAARARDEMDAILGQLSGALGLGGRSRKGASSSERARVAVTKAIKSAIARIAAESPALGRHLTITVSTGNFCVYEPDPHSGPWCDL